MAEQVLIQKDNGQTKSTYLIDKNKYEKRKEYLNNDGWFLKGISVKDIQHLVEAEDKEVKKSKTKAKSSNKES